MLWPSVGSKKGNGRRKRKRSRSPPRPGAVRIPRLQRLRKKKWSGSELWSSAPESFQIFYRTSAPDGMKAFSLRIPSDVLKPFSEVDVSCYHDHRSYPVSRNGSCSGCGSLSRLNLYPDYLCTLFFPDCVPLSNLAVVGSTVYAMFFGGKFAGGKFLSLNLDDPHPHPQPWKQIPSPPFLEEGFTIRTPELVSLGGRLYFFGGYLKPFGQVYDAHSESWSVLPEPPTIADSSKCCMALRTSLGESQGKILFRGYDDPTDYKTNRFHIYDVDCEQWTSFSSTWELDGAPLSDSLMFGKAVVEEDSSTFLYWLDRRGLVYAVDCQTMELFQGPIMGIEGEGLVSSLKSAWFLHIWGDLFCLLWSTLTHPEEQGPPYSGHHFTFLRILNDSKPGYGSLTVYVVGCLQDTVHGQFECRDAVLV